MVLTYVLPLLLAGVVHLWNAGPAGALLALNGLDRWVPLLSQADISSVETSGVLVLKTEAPSIHVWIDVDGVTMHAVEPKTEWRIPIRESTGILLANPSDDQINISFMALGRAGMRLTTGGLAAKRSIAFFATWLLAAEAQSQGITIQNKLDDVLIIRSETPIAVWAADCTARCVATPVQ